MKKMKIIKLFLLIILLFVGCNDSPTEVEILTGDGRIILEEGSADGITIGDDTLKVTQKFGKYDVFVQTRFNGFGWAYFSGIEFLFFRDYPKDTVYQVIGISLRMEYTGKTFHGIGIGTTKEYLRKILKDDSNFTQGESYVDGYSIEERQEEEYLKAITFFYDENNIINRIDIVAYTKN